MLFTSKCGFSYKISAASWKTDDGKKSDQSRLQRAAVRRAHLANIFGDKQGLGSSYRRSGSSTNMNGAGDRVVVTTWTAILCGSADVMEKVSGY